MSGLPGFRMWRRFVQATEERKEFDAEFERFDRRMREEFKDIRRENGDGA